MKRTFTYRSTFAESSILQDFIAGVFNTDVNFGGQILVHEVSMYPTSGANVGGMALVRYSRISAFSGGTSPTPIKHDTSAPNLPSQVVWACLPDSITETDVLLRRTDCPNFSALLALGCISNRGGSRPLDLSKVHRAKVTGPVEAFVLREGEGIAAILTDYGYSHTIPFIARVYNRTTGNTYTFRDPQGRFPRRESEAFFALFNGVGSGAILDVYFMESPVEGTATIPQMRLARIEGVPQGITVGVPSSHDTSYPVPPWVTCGEGPSLSTLKGSADGLPLTWYRDHGAQISVALQQRSGRIRNRVYAPWGTDAGSLLTPPSPCRGRLLYASGMGGPAPIVINPGEGLAILGGREGTIDDSMFNLWFVEVTFTVESPQRLSMTGAVYVS